MGVYKRARGTLVREEAGTDEREAERLLSRRRTEVAEGTYAPDLPGGRARVALSDYAAAFFKDRTTRSVADEEACYRLHVAPHLGKACLDELSPQRVAAWVEVLKASGALAPKSIL
jgi:hypothetical protein